MVSPWGTAARQSAGSAVSWNSILLGRFRFVRSAVRLGVALAAALLFAGLLSGRPHPVLAHAFLISTSPGAGARLGSTPRAIVLTFTEPVVGKGAEKVTVERAGGRGVVLRSLSTTGGGVNVVASLPRLPAGVYLVNWIVVSTNDGHLSAGRFAFAVGKAGHIPASASTTSAPTGWWQGVAGWILLLGIAVGAGTLAGHRLVWQPVTGERLGRELSAVAANATAGAAIASVITLGLLARNFDSAGGTGGLGAIARRTIETRAGALDVLTIALLIFALVTLSLRLWPDVTLVALVLAAGATAARSHPASGSAWFGAPVVVAHVTLAVLWAGALGHLLLVVLPGRSRYSGDVIITVVQRYSRLAVWTAVTVLATGLISALAEFSNPTQLVTTGYGLVLAVKGILVVVGLLAALLARADALPRAAVEAVPVLRGLTRVEAALIVAVIAASALLSNVAPPFVAPTLARGPSQLLGPPPTGEPAAHLAAKAGWLEVYLTASRNQVTVLVLSPEDQGLAQTHLRLTASRPGSSRSVDMFPRSCGPGCFTTRFRWLPGSTRLVAAVSSPRWRGGTVDLRVSWPPGRNGLTRLRQVLTRMSQISTMRIKETVSSAPGRGFPNVGTPSGRVFVRGEPYTGRVGDVRYAGGGNNRQLVIYLSGSNIWVHLWLDGHDRVAREVIVDPGHLIQRTFAYRGP